MAAPRAVQKIYYEIGVENWPPTRSSRYAINGSIWLPVQNTVANISAFAANERFRSFDIFWSYVISVPTPGRFWDSGALLLRVRAALPRAGCTGVARVCAHADGWRWYEGGGWAVREGRYNCCMAAWGVRVVCMCVCCM